MTPPYDFRRNGPENNSIIHGISIEKSSGDYAWTIVSSLQPAVRKNILDGCGPDATGLPNG